MKNAKILTAIVLGCSLLFLMCSCSNVPAKAEDEEINESAESEAEETEDEKTDRPMIVGGGNTDYTIDPTAETIIDEYGIAQTCLPSSELGSILGFDNCYCEGYMDVIGHCNWTIYNGDGEEIACQFGFDCEDAPDCYVADLDDGFFGAGLFVQAQILRGSVAFGMAGSAIAFMLTEAVILVALQIKMPFDFLKVNGKLFFISFFQIGVPVVAIPQNVELRAVGIDVVGIG